MKGHEAKRSIKEEKNENMLEGKFYGDFYVGEGFIDSTFRIFGPLPLTYRPRVGLQIQKALLVKPSPIQKD